jgi:hypothetical protein
MAKHKELTKMNDGPKSTQHPARVQVAFTLSEHSSLSRHGFIRWVSDDGEDYRVWIPDLERAAMTPDIDREILERRGAVFIGRSEQVSPPTD